MLLVFRARAQRISGWICSMSAPDDQPMPKKTSYDSYLCENGHKTRDSVQLSSRAASEWLPQTPTGAPLLECIQIPKNTLPQDAPAPPAKCTVRKSRERGGATNKQQQTRVFWGLGKWNDSFFISRCFNPLPPGPPLRPSEAAVLLPSWPPLVVFCLHCF